MAAGRLDHKCGRWLDRSRAVGRLGYRRAVVDGAILVAGGDGRAGRVQAVDVVTGLLGRGRDERGHEDHVRDAHGHKERDHNNLRWAGAAVGGLMP